VAKCEHFLSGADIYDGDVDDVDVEVGDSDSVGYCYNSTRSTLISG
jgi:hypothetical protein